MVFASIFTGNDFNGIKIQASGIIDRAKKENYPYTVESDNKYVFRSPDGYTFYVTDEQQPGDGDPVQGIVFNTNDLKKTHLYWMDLLTMKLVHQNDTEVCLTYSGNQAKLFYRKTGKPRRIRCFVDLWMLWTCSAKQTVKLIWFFSWSNRS